MARNTLSSAVHQQALAFFSRFVISDDVPGFGRSVGRRIRIAELRASLAKRWAEAVCEIVVEQDMMDCAEGVMHTGCVAYLMDMCTALPYIGLSLAQAEDAKQKGNIDVSQFAMAPYAPSQRLDITYYHPAHLGARLRLICESVTNIGTLLVVRGEIWDMGLDRLIASAIHAKVMPKKPPLAAKGKL